MSIPDRFFRIAKHKMGEVKEWFDRVDSETEEEAAEAERKRRTQEARRDARRELDDAMATSAGDSAVPMQAPPSRRTPEEIARGQRSAGSSYVPATTTTTAPLPPDPLAYHYRLLGLEPGADFSAVKSAYEKFAARSDTSRFPAGSPEAAQALEIRIKLDASYKVLRDALDTTARRFDLLEFDDAPRSL